MPQIIPLKRLINLFGETVNKLPEGPVRQLAAQLMTLTAHVIRVDQKVDAQVKELGAQISTLTDMVQEIANRQGTGTAAPTAPGAAPKSAAPAAPAPADAAEQEEEPNPDDEFEAKMRAEVEAEIAAANAANGTSEVVDVQ